MNSHFDYALRRWFLKWVLREKFSALFYCINRQKMVQNEEKIKIFAYALARIRFFLYLCTGILGDLNFG